jgi:hypothetical protein
MSNDSPNPIVALCDYVRKNFVFADGLCFKPNRVMQTMHFMPVYLMRHFDPMPVGNDKEY